MRIITIILLLLFIAALITTPDHEQFNRYLAKNNKNIGTCLGGTRYFSYKIFSLNYVDYCEPERNKDNSISISLTRSRTDKYLGIFGTFWKLH